MPVALTCTPFPPTPSTQAERQRLDKARAKWQAEAQRRRKEQEAKKRVAMEEEKRAAREKKDAEEALEA